MNTTFRRQGDPVQCGWSIGRAPLRLRGIRFAEGDGGAPPAAPPAGGGQTPAAPAPAASPADVASMLQALGKAAAPAQPQAPAQPAAPIQGFTPEQVQKLMADSAAAQKALEEAQAALNAANTERDEAKATIAQFQREKAVTAAADGKANAALLLDSSKFQAAVKDIDLTDAEKLGAAVEQFVKDNPAYAAAPAGPQLPTTSGGTPAGGTTSKPTTLEGAIAATLAG